MPDYNFKQLSPHDFELLSRDLLQAEEGLRLESFKTGRDGGIDFRFAQGSANSIVQCKHYATTGLDGLVRDLKKEARKAIALKPTRYILTTSVPLSPANKQTIQALFGDILKSADIFGCDDLNNLLGRHTDVERAHYKLWLTSRAVLDRVLHSAVATQSEFEVQKVYEQIQRYVPSAAYPRALDMLRSDNVVIISGQPGVGKTTLAKMLLYQHLEGGFEAVSILTDFQSGRELYQTGKKQVFYFDDFMGSTFLGEKGSSFTRKEDQAILDFIELVRRSAKARLILTTREHILQQAMVISEKMQHSDIIDHRCVLEIGDYSIRQKAEILYNHLYFSDLPLEYQQVLLEDDFYIKIVRHDKFNPRLIEWLSSYRRVRTVAPQDYRSFVQNLLHNPAEIWRHAYLEQISDAGRSVLMALYSWNGKAPSWLLEKTFRRLHAHRAHKYGFASRPEDMRRTFSELNGSFIQSSGSQIEVINPSVLDMLNDVVQKSPENAVDIVIGAIRFEQLSRMWAFANADENQTVLQILVDEAGQLATSIEFLLNAPRKIRDDDSPIVYVDDSLEKRLATLIQIANETRSEALVALIAPFADKLIANWETDRVELTDAVALVNTLMQGGWATMNSGEELQARCLDGILKDAALGCRSDELQELVGFIDFDHAEEEPLRLLRRAFDVYRDQYFFTELQECQSLDEFDGLIEGIEIISSSLDIEAQEEIANAHEQREEFRENQDAYEDHMQDEWKERRYDQHADEASIRDMFGSLSTNNRR